MQEKSGIQWRQKIDSRRKKKKRRRLGSGAGFALCGRGLAPWSIPETTTALFLCCNLRTPLVVEKRRSLCRPMRGGGSKYHAIAHRPAREAEMEKKMENPSGRLRGEEKATRDRGDNRADATFCVNGQYKPEYKTRTLFYSRQWHNKRKYDIKMTTPMAMRPLFLVRAASASQVDRARIQIYTTTTHPTRREREREREKKNAHRDTTMR